MATLRRLLTALTVGCWIVYCLKPPLGLAGDEPPVKQPPSAKQVQTTIKYDRAMIVIVSKDGAAGLRFFDAFELGNKTANGVVGVSYEWRFLSRTPDAEEQTGTGRVFAKLVDGKIRDGSFEVECGPVQLTWAHRNKKLGVVQYNPDDLAVHPVAAHYFAKRKKPFPAERIDLGRFLQPSTETRTTAGPVLYTGSVLVVKDTKGVATFEFGATFERAKGENQTLFGVPYHFTFMSSDQKVRTEGESEVYERYTNRKYDRGQLNLEAGPIHIQWSQGGDELGWVYYDPAQNPVWCVDKPDMETLVSAIAGANAQQDGGE